MEKLSNEGLRTLIFGFKNITFSSIKDLDPSVFEEDLELLGATALEDLLQDDV